MYAVPAVVEWRPAATHSKQGTSTTAGSRRSGGSSLCERLSLSATLLPFTVTRFPSPHPSPSLIPPPPLPASTYLPQTQAHASKTQKRESSRMETVVFFLLLLTGPTDGEAARHACTLCLLCSDAMYIVGPLVNQ